MFTMTMYNLVLRIIPLRENEEFIYEAIGSFDTISRAVGAARRYIRRADKGSCIYRLTLRKYKVRSIDHNGAILAWHYDPKFDRVYKIVLYDESCGTEDDNYSGYSENDEHTGYSSNDYSDDNGYVDSAYLHLASVRCRYDHIRDE